MHIYLLNHGTYDCSHDIILSHEKRFTLEQFKEICHKVINEVTENLAENIPVSYAVKHSEQNESDYSVYDSENYEICSEFFLENIMDDVCKKLLRMGFVMVNPIAKVTYDDYGTYGDIQPILNNRISNENIPILTNAEYRNRIDNEG